MTDLVRKAGDRPISYPGEFVRVIIGSTIHGLSVKDTDDLDLMGIRIESLEECIGLTNKPFEQHVWRTQPEGHPSGAGDVDLTVYSLRKFMKLAGKGNPTLLNLLFVQQKDRHLDSEIGEELRDMTPRIVSREAAYRYAGYLRSQRERLLGERGQKHTGAYRRLKYESEFGWDTKYAMHMIRLGVQGVELLQTGRISLPMQEPLRSEVYNVRLGKIELEAAIGWANELENQLLELAHTATEMRLTADWDYLNKWTLRKYSDYWGMT